MLPNFRQINLQLNFSSLWCITREMRPNFWGEHFSGSHFRGEFFGLLILQIKCPKLLGEMRFKFPKFVSLESSKFFVYDRGNAAQFLATIFSGSQVCRFSV